MSVLEGLDLSLKYVEKTEGELPYFVVKEYPDAALRTPARLFLEPVVGNVMFQELCAVMEKTLDGYRAAGLAGPQVGIFYRVICVRVGGKPLTMINPVLVSVSPNSETATEGCLSFPGLDIKVSRAVGVSASWVDRQGKHNQRFFAGVEARAIQHEIDHLDGKTFLDRVPAFYRRGALEKMQIAQRRAVSSQKRVKAIISAAKAHAANPTSKASMGSRQPLNVADFKAAVEKAMQGAGAP